MTQTLTLDLVRDLWWTSNDRLHWATQRAKTRAVRMLAKAAAREQLRPVSGSVQVRVTCHLPTDRQFDPPNIAGTVAKAALDGITDAGIWADDDSRHVPVTAYDRGPKTSVRGIYRLTIELEEVEAA